ncbi:uncharacterized protein LOC108097504 isoform X1 [Drosophila ficusphila]|uniref:uncharacterized protein LOC108097504 isoform X1 n=1 Tax=Drosophila ficusphila TaxID=30025 RepID=UPI001C8AB83D|nr:uncharacterized protein LOC108097504 isoform X1 [Drosophila ficusphila]
MPKTPAKYQANQRQDKAAFVDEMWSEREAVGAAVNSPSWKPRSSPRPTTCSHDCAGQANTKFKTHKDIKAGNACNNLPASQQQPRQQQMQQNAN